MQCIKQTTTNCYMTLFKLFKSISLYIFCPKVIQFHLHTLVKIQNTATLYPNPPISISPFNWCQKTSDTLTKKTMLFCFSFLLYFSKWCQLRSHGAIHIAYNVIQHGNALGTPSPLSQIPSSVVPSILMEPTLTLNERKASPSRNSA